jgi:hypothetical protein
MEFKSKLLDQQILDLERELAELRTRRDEECKKFVADLESSGWYRFIFFSDYYGSHGEYGEGDDDMEFLFHPSVDCSRWDGITFSHGYNQASSSYNEFQAWLDAIPEDLYIEL